MQTFHVGYPKSGSTTIQDLLKADDSIDFLGKPYRDHEAEYHVREHLSFGDLRQLPAATLDDMRRRLCDGQPIISDEILSGVGLAHGIAANSLLQIVDNIEMLTEGDFVAYVVFRQPDAFIRSYYNQLVRMGARMTFDQFCSLVLLRPHHWVYRSLDYGAILRSRPCREGKLKPVLFETLFKDGGLDDFMRAAFGMARLPEVPTDQRSNRSETDSAADYAAPRLPLNPASSIELQVTQPSVQEYEWLDRLQPDVREHHRSVWSFQHGELQDTMSEYLATLTQARARFGSHAGKRPATPMLRRLLDAIAQTNRGVAEAFPELDFARHNYFG